MNSHIENQEFQILIICSIICRTIVRSTFKSFFRKGPEGCVLSQNEKGETPLHLAAQELAVDMVQLLILKVIDLFIWLS